MAAYVDALGVLWSARDRSKEIRGAKYLAILLDVFSRTIVGWAMETYLRTELILALLPIRPLPPTGQYDSVSTRGPERNTTREPATAPIPLAGFPLIQVRDPVVNEKTKLKLGT